MLFITPSIHSDGDTTGNKKDRLSSNIGMDVDNDRYKNTWLHIELAAIVVFVTM